MATNHIGHEGILSVEQQKPERETLHASISNLKVVTDQLGKHFQQSQRKKELTIYIADFSKRTQ